MSLALAVIALVGGFSLIKSSMNKVSVSRRGVAESSVLATAHGVAALFKQELLANFEQYLAAGSDWSPCRSGAGSVIEFLNALKSPSAACGAARFRLAHFASSDPSSPGELAVLAFAGAVFSAPLNGLSTKITILDFNLDTERNQVVGEVHLEGKFSTYAVSKKIRLVIDVRRTVLAAPPPNAECKPCWTVPGSVCCGVVRLTYLEAGTGRIMDAGFDTATRELKVTERGGESPSPRAVSVKGTGAQRIDYFAASFCLPVFHCPTRYLIDSAVQEGVPYFLTTDGRILDGSGALVRRDPKCQSL